MLFHMCFTTTQADEPTLKRALQVFAAWQPPADIEFKGFYGAVDGGRGYAIVEAADHEALLRTVAPFLPFNSFEVTAIVPIEDAAGILGEAIAFRETVS